MSRLLPHLRNAVRISHEVGSAWNREEELRALFERLRFGAALVDHRGKVVYLNRAARALLSGSGPLRVRDRTLTAATHGEAAHFRTLLRAALPGDGRPPVSGACTVGTTHSEGPLSVFFLPLPENRARRPFLDAEREHDAAALVLLSRDHRPHADAAPVIAAVHGLTAAETQLAIALVAGRSVEQHAERTGVKLSTARTHLVNLRAKLDARTQAQVVAKLLATIPPVTL